jgi:hypothetical protein
MCSMKVHLRPIVARNFSILEGSGEFAWHGTRRAWRWVVHSGRALVADRAVDSVGQAASARMPQPARARSRCDDGDSVRAAHGLPVECAKGHGHLLELLGASALRGMDRGGCVRARLGDGAGRLRRVCRGGLALVVDGRSDEQGAARREKKPGRIPPIAPRVAPSAAC